MFIELMPLIEKRAITITVAALKVKAGLGSAWPTERNPRYSPEATKGTNNRYLRLVRQGAANE